MELDSYTLVLFKAGPKKLDPETERELRAKHIAAAIQRREEGHLLLAGAVPEPAAGLPVTGVAFFRTSAEETRELLATDPAGQAGLFETEIVTFVCQKGSLLSQSEPPSTTSP